MKPNPASAVANTASEAGSGTVLGGVGGGVITRPPRT